MSFLRQSSHHIIRCRTLQDSGSSRMNWQIKRTLPLSHKDKILMQYFEKLKKCHLYRTLLFNTN